MDYAKISEQKQQAVSSRRFKDSNTIRLSSKPIRTRRQKDPPFDLGMVTEEVVEAVYSGFSYNPVSSTLMEAPDSPSGEIPDPMSSRKTCFIVLDLAFEDDWVFSFPVGSWRRIVMNLFGNAVKYTEKGCKCTFACFGNERSRSPAPSRILICRRICSTEKQGESKDGLRFRPLAHILEQAHSLTLWLSYSCFSPCQSIGRELKCPNRYLACDQRFRAGYEPYVPCKWSLPGFLSREFSCRGYWTRS